MIICMKDFIKLILRVIQNKSLLILQVEGASLKVLEARGVVLGHLVISERSTGLYGRPMITFVPARKDAVLPANNFSSGMQ